MKPHYDERLANEDLAPLRKQKWSSYNIFAFWMSDVHSVGGYVTAGSLFALGLQSWQVLVALIAGIVIVVKSLSQPWRGIVDLGVVLGLSWGAIAVVGLFLRSLREGGTSVDPQLPLAQAG